MDAGCQYFQRLGLVAVLATTVLAFGHDACGKVRDTHGRVGFVNVLPPGAAGAIGVNAQIGRVDLDHGGFVLLGQYGDCASAGVDTALSLGGRHALYAVATRLKLERTINPVARRTRGVFQADHYLFVATQLTLRFAHYLGTPAHAFGVTAVHAQQVGCKQGRFVTTCTRANFDEGGACVVRVFGQQQPLQFGFQLRDFGLRTGHFLLRHFGHVGVVQHLLSSAQVGFALSVTLVASSQNGHVSMLARQRHELLHVLHDVFARQQKIQLVQALGIAFELLA